MGKVNQMQDAENERVADGDEGVSTPQHHTIHNLLQQHHQFESLDKDKSKIYAIMTIE